MFYRPELVIYLWLLPVVALVFLPAVWFLISVAYRVVEWSRLGDVRGFVDLSGLKSARSEIVERRKHPRINLDASRAKVAGGLQCCKTYVGNISRQGICFSNIPQKMLREEDGVLKVVFRTRTRDYAMSISPRWRRLGANGCSHLGGEIMRLPSGWEGFVDAFCSTAHADAG